MMKSFLLLILSLMAGYVASADVKGCQDGWVEFTCKYPTPDIHNSRIFVAKEKEQSIESTAKDKWETKGRFSLYHDTENKELKVVIKHLEQSDCGDWKCHFAGGPDLSDEDEQDLKVEKIKTDGCQGPFTQTAYKAAKTTITCDYPGNKYKSSVKFFCKEKDSVCEDILSTASPRPNGTFTLTETNRGFSISISQVSSDDAGVYWCGVKPKEGHYRASLRKIQLEVQDITELIMSLTIGQDFTYWCTYPNGASIKKFICKGEDPSKCQRLVSTAQPNMNTGKFSMKDAGKNGNISITVRDVTPDDAGTYWCGAESTDKTHSNQFFHRFLMIVVPPTASTPSIIPSTSPHPVATSAASATQSAAASAQTDSENGGSWFAVIIVAAACLAVLVLGLILVLVYKRFHCSKSTSGEAQNNSEDGAYTEIQERPQEPNSGTALKTVYVTANFPTSPSHHYSHIHFQNGSGEVSGDTYSTVRDTDQRPPYSTVNNSSRCSADPFYSTVNNPQQL